MKKMGAIKGNTFPDLKFIKKIKKQKKQNHLKNKK